MEFFLAIAEAGSFTRAARVLRVAQPSLSYAVRTLEEELGTALFARHGRGVHLTPAGEALLGPARRTVRSFALAEGAVRSVADGGFGRLRIVSNTLWAVHPLVRLVSEFRQLRPGVQFEVTDPANRTVVLEQVRAGEVDFGLVDGPAPGGPVESQHLVDHEMVAVLPPGQEQRPTVTMADLVPLGLISTPSGTALRALVDEQLERAGQAPEVVIETAHLASVVPLVLARAGVALLPGGMAAEASAKGAQVSRLEPPSRVSVALLWRRGATGPVAADFVEVARGLVADRLL